MSRVILLWLTQIHWGQLCILRSSRLMMLFHSLMAAHGGRFISYTQSQYAYSNSEMSPLHCKFNHRNVHRHYKHILHHGDVIEVWKILVAIIATLLGGIWTESDGGINQVSVKRY